MPQIVNCPECQRQLRVPDDMLGKNVKCPSCGATFAAAGTPPAAPAEAVAPAPVPASPREQDETDEAEERRRQARRRDEDEDDDERPRRRRGEVWDDDEERRPQSVGAVVMAPAICMLIAAVLGVLGNLFQVVQALGPAPPPPPANPNVSPDMQAFLQQVQQGAHGPQAVVMGLLFALINVFIIVSMIQMMRQRSWGFSLAGSILGMVNCGQLCICLTLPIGIWSLIVLCLPRVKEAFH